MLHLIVLSLLLASASAESFLPECDIEQGFDIQGQDLTNVKAPVDMCYDHCRTTPKCLAWSWTDYSGGTCWLKSGADIIIAKPNVRMCRMMVGFNGGALYKDVDFAGSDIGNKQVDTPQNCVYACKVFPGCRAMSWTNYNNGTCWFKSARGVAAVSAGVISSDVYSNTWPHYKPVMLYKSLGKSDIKGKLLNTTYGGDCLAMCKAMGSLCTAVSQISMHHTTCSFYSIVGAVVASTNSYILTWALVAPM